MSEQSPADDAERHREVIRSARPYLLAGCVVVGLEAIALFALGIGEILSTEAERAGLGVSTAVFFVVIGAGLSACMIGLLRHSSWARGPAVLSQFIALGLAWNFRDVSPKIIAVSLLAVAIVGLVGLFAPATTAVLNPEEDLPDDQRGS